MSRSASVTEPSHGPQKKFLRRYLGANDANAQEARTIEVARLRLVDEACHVCALDADGAMLDLLESFEGKDSADKAHALTARLSREAGLPVRVAHGYD
ncbi:hypothetical protein [Bradyrhizobium japonicum]|uniref:hypothetical protein n=1 Tax=Bradyrhizobium japonicum TaxID=375 RepID=UPI001BABB8EB|nr:hypothetical protein [Bradyrhizobium japonicum]MBR0916500.1 hypothetical protein [Bradyrhizobium japonicum]